MRVWLFKTGEPLPCDFGSPRRLRTGMIAETLVDRGHDVVWWSSTFNQVSRTDRFASDTMLQLQPRFRLWLLHSVGYTKNVSFDRIKYNRRTALAFERVARTEPKPDIILCSMPTIENALAATNYGLQHNVPVVLDCRDMWPDIILDRFPKWGQPLAKHLLGSMYRNMRAAAQQATALTGITNDFVDWVVGYADRDRTPLDRAFPLAYSGNAPSHQEQQNASEFWQKHGIGGNGEFVVCFFGNISPRYELSDVIRAARILEARSFNGRFIICGDGEALPQLKKEAGNLKNVLFPGWLGAPEIWSLMRYSQLGVVPYPSTRDYRISVPNKAIEYLSAGLPVVTSLSGTLHQLLESNGCGTRYPNGNAEALASLVMKAAQSPQWLQRMVQNASQLFEREFVGERVYGQMCDYLETIIESHGNQSRLAA